jgi:hypothetical protein
LGRTSIFRALRGRNLRTGKRFFNRIEDGHERTNTGYLEKHSVTASARDKEHLRISPRSLRCARQK